MTGSSATLISCYLILLFKQYGQIKVVSSGDGKFSYVDLLLLLFTVLVLVAHPVVLRLFRHTLVTCLSYSLGIVALCLNEQVTGVRLLTGHADHPTRAEHEAVQPGEVLEATR